MTGERLQRYLCIDIGGTRLRAAVADGEGAIAASVSASTPAAQGGAGAAAVVCRLCDDALERAGGQKQQAADLLNIHRKTLYNKMKKLGMS